MITNEPDPDVSQAELAWVTPAAFTARMDRVCSRLTAGAQAAQWASRTTPGVVPSVGTGVMRCPDRKR